MQQLAPKEPNDEAAMQFYELRCTDQPEGSLNGGLFALCLASGFVAVGVSLFLIWSRGGSPIAEVRLAAVAAIALGALAIPSAVRQVAAARRLGRPRLEVSTETPLPGTPFQLRYLQDITSSPKVEVVLSLVLREFVRNETSDGVVIEKLDHLLQYVERRVVPGSDITLLRLFHEFTIPEKGASEYQTGNWPVAWLIKSRVDLGLGVLMWREFELPCYGDRVAPVAPIGWRELEAAPAEKHSVVLLRCKWPMTRAQVRAVRAVAPHLTSGQIESIPPKLPAVLAEGLTRDDAEGARARLEAAGAAVEVREGIRVVEPPPGRQFPIPHALPSAPIDSLPRPADGVSE